MRSGAKNERSGSERRAGSRARAHPRWHTRGVSTHRQPPTPGAAVAKLRDRLEREAAERGLTPEEAAAAADDEARQRWRDSGQPGDFRYEHEYDVAAVPFAFLGSAYAEIGALDELAHGAMEYGLGRDAAKKDPTLPMPFDEIMVLLADPPSASALRVATALLGAWHSIRAPGCTRGAHPPGCVHRRYLYVGARPLARASFGSDGGTQTAQLHRALAELARSTTYYVWNAARRTYYRETSPVVLIRELGRLPEHAKPGDAPADAFYEIAWSPFLLDSLLAGHYRLIPMALVRALRGRSHYRFWLPILMHPVVSQLRKVGDYRELTISGPRALIPSRRLGLGGQRPDRMRASAEAACRAGNPVSPVRLEVLPTADGRGLKVRATLVEEVRHVEPEVRHVEPSGAACQATERGMSSRRARHVRPRSEHETGPVGILQGTSSERLESTRAGARVSSERTERPDIDALRARWPRVTKRQIRVLDELADRHDVTGYEWAAQRIRDAPQGDPLGDVLAEDRAWQAERRREADAAEQNSRAEHAEPSLEGLRMLREAIGRREYHR